MHIAASFIWNLAVELIILYFDRGVVLCLRLWHDLVILLLGRLDQTLDVSPLHANVVFITSGQSSSHQLTFD